MAKKPTEEKKAEEPKKRFFHKLTEAQKKEAATLLGQGKIVLRGPNCEIIQQ